MTFVPKARLGTLALIDLQDLQAYRLTDSQSYRLTDLQDLQTFSYTIFLLRGKFPKSMLCHVTINRYFL